jgi:hypothetical protein
MESETGVRTRAARLSAGRTPQKEKLPITQLLKAFRS